MTEHEAIWLTVGRYVRELEGELAVARLDVVGIDAIRRGIFLFKQKTAYEMIWLLEFRRVLFRSKRGYAPTLEVGEVLVDRRERAQAEMPADLLERRRVAALDDVGVEIVDELLLSLRQHRARGDRKRVVLGNMVHLGARRVTHIEI